MLVLSAPADSTSNTGGANTAYFDGYVNESWTYHGTNPLTVQLNNGSRQFTGKTQGNSFAFTETNLNNGAYVGGTWKSSFAPPSTGTWSRPTVLAQTQRRRAGLRVSVRRCQQLQLDHPVLEATAHGIRNRLVDVNQFGRSMRSRPIQNLLLRRTHQPGSRPPNRARASCHGPTKRSGDGSVG